uniref:Uncharacterized protein n=1 Tax=Steinernema glaseri TaxID=37863 RepID=A0A1I7YX78_9BILA
MPESGIEPSSTCSVNAGTIDVVLYLGLYIDMEMLRWLGRNCNIHMCSLKVALLQQTSSFKTLKGTNGKEI